MNATGAYILRRLLLVPVTLFGVTVVVFLVVRLAPGDPIAAYLGELSAEADPGVRAAMEKSIRERLHLDEPMFVQYWFWLVDLWQTGMGTSIKHNRPVIDLVAERLPVTIGLNLCAFVVTYTIAIPLGMLSAASHNRAPDRMIGLGSLVFYSMPPIWVGTLLLVFLANPEQLGWFPPGGLTTIGTDRALFLDRLGDLAVHMMLPVATLSAAQFAYVSRQMRAGLLDTLRQDYIRTARAKGLGGTTVMLRHALPNSLLPIITLLATLLPSMMAGSIIVETIFSIPGMGGMVIEAINGRDFAVVQAVAGAAGFLNITGLLLADILYALADPRISFD